MPAELGKPNVFAVTMNKDMVYKIAMRKMLDWLNSWFGDSRIDEKKECMSIIKATEGFEDLKNAWAELNVKDGNYIYWPQISCTVLKVKELYEKKTIEYEYFP